MGGHRFCKLMLMVIGGILLAVRAMAVPMVDLVLVDAPSAVGDTFEVEVWVDGDDMGLDLLAFGFDVGFDDGTVFDYVGYELGSGFDALIIADNRVTADIFPGIVQDDVLLATLSFSTLSLGTDTLNITGLYDGMFSGLYYELPDWNPAGYDIKASLSLKVADVPVPEPATFVLFASGLIGCAGISRKSRKQVA